MSYPHIDGEKRLLMLNEKLINTAKPEILEWNGKYVTVVSWHENITMRKLFPHDEIVGHIKELGYDIPESELLPF